MSRAASVQSPAPVDRNFFSCRGFLFLFVCVCGGYFPLSKMPADMMEKTSSSPVAATPASMNTTPDKPKTASEHRKVCIRLLANNAHRLVPSKQTHTKHFLSNSQLGLCLYARNKTEKINASCHFGVFFKYFFFSLVVQANYGKEEKSQNQREFGPVENSHPGCAEKRCK